MRDAKLTVDDLSDCAGDDPAQSNHLPEHFQNRGHVVAGARQKWGAEKGPFWLNRPGFSGGSRPTPLNEVTDRVQQGRPRPHELT